MGGGGGGGEASLKGKVCLLNVSAWMFGDENVEGWAYKALW